MKNRVTQSIVFLFISFFSFSQKIDSIAYHSRKFENLKRKYNSDEFNYDEKFSEANASAWERFWRAVEHFFEQLFNFGNSAKTLSGLELLMRILAVLIILFVIYMIVKIIINKEGGWIFSSSERKIKVINDVIENIHTIDFKTIINNALLNNNYRLAIRYYYLWLLKSLSDKGAIEWDIEKTNSDYLSEIQSEDLKKDFRFLSYVYEYSWYGEFEINDTDFSKTETAFLKLISK